MKTSNQCNIYRSIHSYWILELHFPVASLSTYNYRLIL